MVVQKKKRGVLNVFCGSSTAVVACGGGVVNACCWGSFNNLKKHITLKTGDPYFKLIVIYRQHDGWLNHR